MRKEETTIWKSISGYEGLYEVSNKGEVRGLNYMNTGATRKLSLGVNPVTGYVQVSLRKNGHGKMFYVHRLVAQAFIPNPLNLEQVDHIDSNKQNNANWNLRWISRKDNNSRKHAILMRMRNGKKTSHVGEIVEATNLSTGEVRHFKNARQASQKIGCSHVMVIKVLRGDFKQTMGWALKYVDRNAPANLKVELDLVERKPSINALLKEYTRRRKVAMKELERKLEECFREEQKLGLGFTPIEEQRKIARRARHAIIQYTLDGCFVKEWKNLSQAQSETGLWNIRLAALGIIPDAGGYVWKYKIEA